MDGEVREVSRLYITCAVYIRGESSKKPGQMGPMLLTFVIREPSLVVSQLGQGGCLVIVSPQAIWETCVAHCPFTAISFRGHYGIQKISP